jgi:hypothetical protein
MLVLYVYMYMYDVGYADNLNCQKWVTLTVKGG